MTLLICRGCGKLVDQRHRCENLEILLAREAVRQEANAFAGARERSPIQLETFSTATAALSAPRKLHWVEKQRLARKREKTRLRVQKMRERRKAEQQAAE